MGAWRYEIISLARCAHSQVSEDSKRNFVSPRGHVNFFVFLTKSANLKVTVNYGFRIEHSSIRDVSQLSFFCDVQTNTHHPKPKHPRGRERWATNQTSTRIADSLPEHPVFSALVLRVEKKRQKKKSVKKPITLADYTVKKEIQKLRVQKLRERS